MMIYLANDIPAPSAFKVNADPDTLTYDEAMADPDRDRWLESMLVEITSLESKEAWDEVFTDEARTRILPGTWVFRRKRNPDGMITKFKAWYCVRGDLQEDDSPTYAPVVAWSSVRIFLVLTMTMGWYTCSIDFSNAFVQAVLEEPIWIHLPRGFLSGLSRLSGGARTCLRLKKSLYGTKFAPRLWYQHLFRTLVDDLGFCQSDHDSCLLTKKDMILVVFVDDAGIGSKRKEDADNLVQQLVDRGFELTREGTFTEFLGIKFDKDKSAGTITLTQQGLIQKIVDTTGMQDCNPNWTPASPMALGSDPDGETMREEWLYSSIVGMLLYLSTNTSPDIAFAVSQVARFNHSPKQSHAKAVKMIVRYLFRTADKGTIVKTTGKLELDCYVDADFAGLYRCESDENPTSVKSRTGYIILLGGFPLVWKSQLQTEISLSTLESEYSALSQSMRTLLPLRRTLLETAQRIALPSALLETFACRVFEDNNGALLLATGQRITSRTKYFLVKWHFFWSHVNSGEVEVLKVDTKEQRADYLTKGLSREQYETIRKLVQGW